MGRNTLYIYLKNLKDAGIINLLNRPGRGIAVLQKPEKIYFENTAYAYAFQHTPQAGTIRETFFVNQLINAGNSPMALWFFVLTGLWLSPGRRGH